MPKLILHHIDVLNEEYISGWCLNRIVPVTAIAIELRIDGKSIGNVVCDRLRSDVRRAGLHRTGHCGFEFKFPELLDLSSSGEFSITCFGGLVTLVKIPVASIRPAIHPEKSVFFMHIPKTAGTSFNNHVHSWFSFGKWHSHIEVLDLETQRSLIGPGKYLAGHIPLYKLKDIEPELSKLDLHTIVRRPIDQLHSHLSWLNGIGADPTSGFFKAHQPIIQELALRMQNVEFDHASGIERFVQQMEGFQYDFFDNLQTRYMLFSRPERVSQADLELAIKNLELFKTIGTTESYQHYLDRCARHYGQRPSVQTTRHNPAKVMPLFDKTDPSILDAIDPLIQFENLLYQHITSHYSHG
ncbi:MAG: hypothetical protein ACR2QW_15620 [bacterium]